MAAAGLFRGFGGLVVAAALCCPMWAQEQAADGGVTYTRNEELLESVFIPMMPGAPFSLKLSAEWAKPMANGGTYTTANLRPIMRDSAGRIYQERWLMAPKGSSTASRMSWIQIADPVAHTFYECTPRQHVCELRTLKDSAALRLNPNGMRSGPLPNGQGFRMHEDLGKEFFAGVAVEHYRDTTTVHPGAMGNDLAMVTTREFRFSPALGFNLTSVLDTPSVGKQTFTVTEISTTEPDARYFQPPEGYRIVDYRKAAAPPE